MTDVKFTPGPWEWSEDRFRGGYSGLVGANGQEVLFPNAANDGDEGAAWFEDFPSAADEHLIAASPDLYEALKDLRACIMETRGTDASDAVIAADAALKKAEGRP